MSTPRLCQNHSAYGVVSVNNNLDQNPNIPSGPFKLNRGPQLIRWDVDGTLRQIVDFGTLTIPQMVASGNYTWIDTATEYQYYLVSGNLSNPVSGVHTRVPNGLVYTDIYGNSASVNSGYSATAIGMRQPSYSGNGVIVLNVSGASLAYGSVYGSSYNERARIDHDPYVVEDVVGVMDIEVGEHDRQATSVTGGMFAYFGRARVVDSWVPYGGGKTPVTSLPVGYFVADGAGVRPQMVLSSSVFASHFSGFAPYVGDSNYMQLFEGGITCKMLDGPNGTVTLMLRSGGRLQVGDNSFISVPGESRLFVCNAGGIVGTYNPPGLLTLNNTFVSLTEAQRVFDNGDYLVCCTDFWSPGGLYRCDPNGAIVTRYRVPAFALKGGLCYTSGNSVYLMHTGVSNRPEV